jgi:hypothetical protein
MIYKWSSAVSSHRKLVTKLLPPTVVSSANLQNWKNAAGHPTLCILCACQGWVPYFYVAIGAIQCCFDPPSAFFLYHMPWSLLSFRFSQEAKLCCSSIIVSAQLFQAGLLSTLSSKPHDSPSHTKNITLPTTCQLSQSSGSWLCCSLAWSGAQWLHSQPPYLLSGGHPPPCPLWSPTHLQMEINPFSPRFHGLLITMN